MDQKDYKQLESFTIAALMTPNFMKENAKAKEAEFICLIACILNKNGHFAYNFIKEICVKDVNNFRAWNLFCQVSVLLYNTLLFATSHPRLHNQPACDFVT